MTGLAIAIGGACGAIARHAAAEWAWWPAASMATVAINLAGSLLLGLLVGWLPVWRAPLAVRAGLTVGFCGGFTTFSAFAYETVTLVHLGHSWLPIARVAVLLTLGPALTMAGLWLSGALPLVREPERPS